MTIEEQEHSASQRPDGSIDLTLLLDETVRHIRLQNEHQANQLIKSDEVLRQLGKSNFRANLLLLAAGVLVILGAVQQAQIVDFNRQQQQVRDRYTMLEQAVDQKLTDSSASMTRKVEQIELASPKVVTDDHGDLSLSVPVQPVQPHSINATPIPVLRPLKKTKPAASTAPPAASPPNDFVLVPLRSAE